MKSFPAIIESLGPIREYLQSIAAQAGLGKKQTYGLCLAVDEVVTNIILYGYGSSDHKGGVDLSVEMDEKQLKITVADDAPPFDPTQQKLPEERDLKKPLEDREIGGLGLFLAATNVDEFHYTYAAGRNMNIFVVKQASER